MNAPEAEVVHVTVFWAPTVPWLVYEVEVSPAHPPVDSRRQEVPSAGSNDDTGIVTTMLQLTPFADGQRSEAGAAVEAPKVAFTTSEEMTEAVARTP